jgi:hypothetical protein
MVDAGQAALAVEADFRRIFATKWKTPQEAWSAFGGPPCIGVLENNHTSNITIFFRLFFVL